MAAVRAMHRNVPTRRLWLALCASALLVALGLWTWHGARDHAGAGAAGGDAMASAAPAVRAGTRDAPSAAHGAAAIAAAAGQRYGAPMDAALRAHWQRLVREGDPRQRLIALRMLGGSRDLAARRRARALAAAALAEAPDDPLVAQMQAWFCHDRPRECTPAQLDAWARREPDNPAALGNRLAHAQGDPVRVDALMAQAARGGRYESHHHELMLETVASFDGLAWPPLTAEARRLLREAGMAGTDEAAHRALVMSRIVALPMSNLSGIVQACRPPVSSTRARDCRVVLARMAGATTLVERGIAYSLLARLSVGTPEGLHWRALDQRHRWWTRQFAFLVPGDAYWNDLLRLGEVEAMRRALLAAGRPLDPPPGWRAPGT